MDGSMPPLEAIGYAMMELRNAETTRGALALEASRNAGLGADSAADQGASPQLLRMLKDHICSAQEALTIAKRNYLATSGHGTSCDGDHNTPPLGLSGLAVNSEKVNNGDQPW